MKYRDLRDFIDQLEQRGELKRIRVPVDPYLEVTEICDRTLRAGGPALLFERPKGSRIPLLGNLFGTPKRVALGMGEESVEALREVGRLLAFLKEPDPPKGMKEAWRIAADLQEGAGHGAEGAPQSALPGGRAGGRRRGSRPAADPALLARRCRAADHLGPGDHPRPGEVAPEPRHLPDAGDRPQRVIMRWLAHRGGALDYRDWQRAPGKPFPVAVALGADPATILGAVTPVPDTPVGVCLRRPAARQPHRTGRLHGQRPAGAGQRRDRPGGPPAPRRHGARGPFGDHTGYYNEVDTSRCSPSSA
jgi:4-hydroxy-3-polyprenylbenzoate decarboxylase